MGRPRLLLLLAPLAACANAQPATPVEVEWVRKNAAVFDGVEAGHGFADLKGLKTLVGDARIVALGEPTHGSREVFQMKHRLLEYLVEELGFTVFSIEANMPEAFAVGRYVLDGDGDPRALIRGMYFWTWSTEEVHDMVRWMRKHNLEAGKRGGSRVRFTGFDAQTPDVAAGIVETFVAKDDGSFLVVPRPRSGGAPASHPLSTPPPDSFEHAFQATGLPRFILDLRKAVPRSTESGWMCEKRPFRSIGAVETESQFFPTALRDSFDAVVWIGTTSSAVPLGN
jgi:erythromycin esterase-like protein